LRQWIAKTVPIVVGVVIASSIFVRIEPAPCDYAMAVLVPLTFVFGLLDFPKALCLPIATLGSFLLFNGVSLLRAGDLLYSARYAFITTYLVVSGLFFAGLVAHYRDRALRWLWRGYVAGGLLAAALGWLGVIGAPYCERFVWGELRAVAGFKDPNVYGAFLVPAVLFALQRLRWSRGRTEFLAWSPAFGLMVAGQVLSQSRAGWLNLLVATVSYAALSGDIHWSTLKRYALGCVMALWWLGLAIIVNPRILSFIETRTGLMEYDQERFSVQAAILTKIAVSPWGIGPGETERVFNYAAHNLYLRVLVENGWLGGLAFGAFLTISVWGLLKRIWKATEELERSNRAVVAATLIGALVNSCFIDSLHWRHLWLLLGLALGYLALGKVKTSDTRESERRSNV